MKTPTNKNATPATMPAISPADDISIPGARYDGTPMIQGWTIPHTYDGVTSEVPANMKWIECNDGSWVKNPHATPAPECEPLNPVSLWSWYGDIIDTADTADTARQDAFNAVKRNWEKNPQDADTLYPLARAMTFSVLKKVIDPRRSADAKNPANDGNPTASGYNPVMVSIRRDVMQDTSILENLYTAINNATTWKHNSDGAVIIETIDEKEQERANALIGETLGDGMDLVHDAIVKALEERENHETPAPGWMDKAYAETRLSRRVYIKLDDSMAYREDETTPVQEICRAVRRSIENSRAVRTNPASKYTYIDGMTDGGDTFYLRLGKYADLGGNVSGSYGIPGENPAPGKIYTADIETVRDYYTMVSSLELTARQAQVLKLREQGHGYKAIASYLGVSDKAIKKTVKQIQAKAVKAFAWDTPATAETPAPATAETPAPAPVSFIESLRARAKERATHRTAIQREIDSLSPHKPMIEVTARTANIWDYINEYLESGWFLK